MDGTIHRNHQNDKDANWLVHNYQWEFRWIASGGKKWPKVLYDILFGVSISSKNYRLPKVL